MDKETLIEILEENKDANLLLKALKHNIFTDEEVNKLWKSYKENLLTKAIELNQAAIKQLKLFRKDE